MQVAIARRWADRSSGGRGSLALRARVFARRGVLDRLLAAGADPSWDPELALRAAQLTTPRRRRALAESLLRVVRDADRPQRWSCAAPLDRGAVRQAAPALRALAADLCDQAAPQAISLAEQLLRDPGSPLYAGGDADALRRSVRIARDHARPLSSRELA
jgi:hypothetical protein